MKDKFELLKIFLFFNLLIIQIKSNDDDYEINYPENIIKKSEKQGYNISNPQDIFFSDICQYYTTENKTDVTLEYRRKYFYYPNEKQKIIENNYLLNKTFSEPKRESIFLCFKQYFNLFIICNNVFIFCMIPIFIFQNFIFIFFLFGKYKDASENNSEAFFNYIEKKRIKKRKLIEKNISLRKYQENYNNNEDNKNTFSSLKEEYGNNIINNNDIKIKEENKNNENKIINYHKSFISQTLENQNKEETETKDDILNTTGDFQHSINEKDNKEEENENNDINNQNKKILNLDEIYTFGGLKLNDIKIRGKENEESNEEKKINETESKKAEKVQYVYNKINNKNNFKEYNIINNNNSSKTDEIIQLTNEELFYSGFSVAILKDKRTFKEIYFDILKHCQIIIYFMPNFFIYEDYRLTIIYYIIKLYLYLFINIIFYNNNNVINSIFDNEFLFLNFFFICLLTTIIVNILSQFLFILTNSKRMYIKYINKMKMSLFSKKRIFKYVTKDIIDLINNILFYKIFILFCLNIIIFILTFFFSLCFFVSYQNTKFLVIKSLIICILISQISPFFLALIPAKIRKKAIEYKDNKLFQIGKLINSYFLP